MRHSQKMTVANSVANAGKYSSMRYCCVCTRGSMSVAFDASSHNFATVELYQVNRLGKFGLCTVYTQVDPKNIAILCSAVWRIALTSAFLLIPAHTKILIHQPRLDALQKGNMYSQAPFYIKRSKCIELVTEGDIYIYYIIQIEYINALVN